MPGCAAVGWLYPDSFRRSDITRQTPLSTGCHPRQYPLPWTLADAGCPSPAPV